MGFWDNITGFTFDGLPALFSRDVRVLVEMSGRTPLLKPNVFTKMPDNVKLVYSIKNHLRQLINMPKGSDWKNSDMGIEDIPDFMTSVTSWTPEFGKSLKLMIKKYEKRIKEIYLINWRIDGKLCCLTCRIIVITENRAVIRYRAVFSALGSRVVEITTGEDEE